MRYRVYSLILNVSNFDFFFFFQAEDGIRDIGVTGVRRVLFRSGIVSAPIAWLSQPDSAFWGVVFVGVWKYFPFVVVIVLARLQVIPQDLYEAARIDGAGAVSRFLDIDRKSVV